MAKKRKSRTLVPIMTRIPERLRLRLAASAKRNGCSMNAEIIDRLDQSFWGKPQNGYTGYEILNAKPEDVFTAAELGLK